MTSITVFLMFGFIALHGIKSSARMVTWPLWYKTTCESPNCRQKIEQFYYKALKTYFLIKRERATSVLIVWLLSSGSKGEKLPHLQDSAPGGRTAGDFAAASSLTKTQKSEVLDNGMWHHHMCNTTNTLNFVIQNYIQQRPKYIVRFWSDLLYDTSV